MTAPDRLAVQKDHTPAKVVAKATLAAKARAAPLAAEKVGVSNARNL